MIVCPWFPLSPANDIRHNPPPPKKWNQLSCLRLVIVLCFSGRQAASQWKGSGTIACGEKTTSRKSLSERICGGEPLNDGTKKSEASKKEGPSLRGAMKRMPSSIAVSPATSPFLPRRRRVHLLLPANQRNTKINVRGCTNGVNDADSSFFSSDYESRGSHIRWLIHRREQRDTHCVGAGICRPLFFRGDHQTRQMQDST